MNTELFSLIAKFTVHARKLVGHVDTSQLLDNPNYRDAIFTKIDNEGDEQFMILALMLKEHLHTPAKVEEAAPILATSEAQTKKYAFGARG